MLSRFHRPIRKDDEGFTLIELLVVMIIIGILAAIAIPVFLTQRSKARDTGTKSDVTNVGKELATYYVDNTGTVTGTISGSKITLGDGASFSTSLNLSSGSSLIGAATSAVSYPACVNGTTYTNANNWIVGLTNSSGSQKTFYYSAMSGLSTTAPTTCQ